MRKGSIKTYSPRCDQQAQVQMAAEQSERTTVIRRSERIGGEDYRQESAHSLTVALGSEAGFRIVTTPQINTSTVLRWACSRR